MYAWIWDAACSIRGAQEAPKFKDFILPLVFTKRLCDVFDDELNRIAKEGRTVLFVSHNAHAIRALCTRAIMLKDGMVHADGKPLEVLTQYERENQGVRRWLGH